MSNTSNSLIRKKPALVSIHDAMPSNLKDVLETIGLLKSLAVHPITLLIVPGKNWRHAEITILKKLQENDGIELAGHGWRHRVDHFGTWRHRIHGLLISRKEAEHMPLEWHEIAELINKSYHWFLEVGLKPPDLYVPPAWAMGQIDRKKLRTLPYRFYETLFGVYDSHQDRFQSMAVCGYMADTAVRSLLLRGINAINQRLSFLPLRIAIHPNDLRLPLATDLTACLKQNFCFSDHRLSLWSQPGN